MGLGWGRWAGVSHATHCPADVHPHSSAPSTLEFADPSPAPLPPLTPAPCLQHSGGPSLGEKLYLSYVSGAICAGGMHPKDQGFKQYR